MLVVSWLSAATATRFLAAPQPPSAAVGSPTGMVPMPGLLPAAADPPLLLLPSPKAACDAVHSSTSGSTGGCHVVIGARSVQSGFKLQVVVLAGVRAVRWLAADVEIKSIGCTEGGAGSTQWRGTTCILCWCYCCSASRPTAGAKGFKVCVCCHSSPEVSLCTEPRKPRQQHSPSSP